MFVVGTNDVQHCFTFFSLSWFIKKIVSISNELHGFVGISCCSELAWCVFSSLVSLVWCPTILQWGGGVTNCYYTAVVLQVSHILKNESWVFFFLVVVSELQP